MNSPAVGKSTSKKWSAEIIRCKEGNTFSVRHREGKDCISELLFFSTVCNADHITMQHTRNLNDYVSKTEGKKENKQSKL